MSAITYRHGAKEEIFSSNVPSVRSKEKGDEYKVYLQLLSRIKAAVENPSQQEGSALPICLGNIDNELMKRLCADASLDPLLLPEKERIENFPDFTLVYEDTLMIFDHFHVDASQPAAKRGKPGGTTYLKFIKTFPSEEKADYGNLETILERERIAFSTDCLASNLKRKWNEKLDNIPKYIEAVCNYMRAQASQGIGLEHIPERKEVWFVIEDVSPTCGFALIGREIADLLEESPGLSGIILLHIPDPLQLDIRCEGVAFIRNDDRARERLRNLNKTTQADCTP